VSGVEIAATFFRNDYKNQIVAASIASGTAVTNGGKTLQQGFELTGQVDSGTILLSPHNFYLRTAYTFLPTAEFRGQRFSSITTASILQQLCPANRLLQITPTSRQCSITGNRLPYAPETQLTSSLGYSHPVGIETFIVDRSRGILPSQSRLLQAGFKLNF
jgi:Fe(3+) dicitrate transport protein